MILQLKTWQRAVLAAAMAGAVVMVSAWLCVRDPKIVLFPADGSAEWILFPSACNATARRNADLDAVFRKEFVLNQKPLTALLNIRAAKRFRVSINNHPVEFQTAANWKKRSSADVSGHLRPGTNTMEVAVFNENGPPSLCLTLATDKVALRSDSTWDVSYAGSAWRHAIPASAPRLPGPGNPLSGGERTLQSLSGVWPLWLAFALLALGIELIGGRFFTRLRTVHVMILVGVVWTVLFWHNIRLLPGGLGFDAPHHLDYIAYIQERRALPLPDQGWEMYQPPLYYGISASVLSSFGLTVHDEAGITCLRLLGLLTGFANCWMVFLSLRLLFPNRSDPQLAGLALAAFLPMHLYLTHYVTNEPLSALLVSATLYLSVRILNTTVARSWKSYAALGVLVGAALLAKITALLVVPFAFAAVAIRLGINRPRAVVWVQTVGVMLLGAFAVCGWHYVRIWRRFGTPLVGNWDAAIGFNWWQDKGWHTFADFVRLGPALDRPLFSGFAGFADGIYSTLWGDGMCGGVIDLEMRPPWNYGLMTAGYLLALIPMVILLVGAVTAFWRFVRRPSPDLFVLLGVSAAVVGGMIFMSLKVPSFAQAKAFYGLCLLVPMCFFGAIGWEVLTRGRKWLRLALGVVLLVWVMNSFASMWIRGDMTHTRILLGQRLVVQKQNADAVAEFRKAVNADPSSARARRWLSWGLLQAGKVEEALQQASSAVELDPKNAPNRLQLGTVLANMGQIGKAAAEGRRAADLAPEYLPAHRYLTQWLSDSGRMEEALLAAREGLAVVPDDPVLHCSLGRLFAEKQDWESAARHLNYALMVKPDFSTAHFLLGMTLLNSANPEKAVTHLREAARLTPDDPMILTELAWLLATHPDAKVRNGAEAVRLAECARVSQGGKHFEPLQALAAAYAETGRYPDAIKTGREALAMAQSSGTGEGAAQIQKLILLFESGQPYRQGGPPPE